MAYARQGFVDGEVLTAQHLINMENAIVEALEGIPVSTIKTISLLAGSWNGSGNIYSQAIAVDGVTANSKVDLLPSPEQLNDLLVSEISLMAANNNGFVTVFALGGIPTDDLVLQAMITEVIGLEEII